MKNFVCNPRLSTAPASRRSSAAPAYLFAFLLTLASLVSPAQARATDSPAGSVHGTVTFIGADGKSYGAPGAQIRLIGAAGVAIQFAIADDSGQYKFDSARPGNYQLEVTLEGFEKLARSIAIHAGEVIVENVKLTGKGWGERDSVNAERVGLSLKDAGPATAQPSQTLSLSDERARDALRLNVKGLLASHGALAVRSTEAGNTFHGNPKPHFLSAPNQTIQVPKLFSPEISISKSIALKVSPKVSLKNSNHSRRPQFPDVQGFYPRDFQGNLANTNFGMFSNGVGRMFGLRFVIEKK